MIGSGDVTAYADWVNTGGGLYVTDSSFSNCEQGVTGNIIRNVSVNHVWQGGGATGGNDLVINYSVTDIASDQPGAIGFHAHGFLIYNNINLSEHNHLWNVSCDRRRCGGGAGFLSDAQPLN